MANRPSTPASDPDKVVSKKRVRKPATTSQANGTANTAANLTCPSTPAPVPQNSPSKKRGRPDTDVGEATPKPKRVRKAAAEATPAASSTTSTKKVAAPKRKAATRKAAVVKKTGLPGLNPEPEETPTTNVTTATASKPKRVMKAAKKPCKLNHPHNGVSNTDKTAGSTSDSHAAASKEADTAVNGTEQLVGKKRPRSSLDGAESEPKRIKKGPTAVQGSQRKSNVSTFDRPSAAIANFAAEQADSLKKPAGLRKKAVPRKRSGLPTSTPEPEDAPVEKAALRRSPRKKTALPELNLAPEAGLSEKAALRRSPRKTTPLPTFTPEFPTTIAASPKKTVTRGSPRKSAARKSAALKKTASPRDKDVFTNVPSLAIPTNSPDVALTYGASSRVKKSSLKKGPSKSDSPRKSVTFDVSDPSSPQRLSLRISLPKFSGDLSSAVFDSDNDDESNCDAPRKSVYSDSEFSSDFSCRSSWSKDENEGEDDGQKWDLPQAVEDPVTASISPNIRICLRSSNPEHEGAVYFAIKDLLRNSLRIHFLVKQHGSAILDDAEISVPAWLSPSTIMDYNIYITSKTRGHLPHDQPHWGHHPKRLMDLYLLAIYMQDPDCSDAALSSLIRALRAADELDVCIPTIANFFRRLDHLAHGADTFSNPTDPDHHITRVLAYAAPARGFFADLLTCAGAVAAVAADILALDAGRPADDWHPSLLDAVRARLQAPDAKTLRDDPVFLAQEAKWCAHYHIHGALGQSCAVLEGLKKAEGDELPEDRATEREGARVFWEERAARKRAREMEVERLQRQERLEAERRRFIEETTFTDSEESESEDESDYE